MLPAMTGTLSGMLRNAVRDPLGAYSTQAFSTSTLRAFCDEERTGWRKRG